MLPLRYWGAPNGRVEERGCQAREGEMKNAFHLEEQSPYPLKGEWVTITDTLGRV